MSNAQVKQPTLLEKLQLQKLLDEKNAEGKVGSTLANVVYDVALAVGAGGFIGAVLGKHSFWPGLLATGAGYYWNLRPLKAIGIGMMASSHLLAPNERAARTKEGFDKNAEWQDAKSRMKQYGSSLLERTYLDKVVNLFKKKENSSSEQSNQTSSEAIEQPPAEMQAAVNGLGEPDFAALDRFGQQIVASAVEYQRASPSQQTSPVNGPREVDMDHW